MDIISLLVILLTISGLFIWNRAEGRSDIRHMDAQVNAIRELAREMHNDARDFRETWINESKDFHYRLLEIEKNRK
jgi:hypothetical protein